MIPRALSRRPTTRFALCDILPNRRIVKRLKTNRSLNPMDIIIIRKRLYEMYNQAFALDVRSFSL